MGSAIDVKDFDSALVALGGHALEKDGDVYSFEAMQNGVWAIAQVFDQEGRKIPLAITHGNGLQVGLLEQLYRGEFDAGSLADKAFLGGYGVMDDADDYIERQETPSYAHLIKVTQDVIGGMAVRALRPWVDRAMYVHNTQVIVDPADPRFKTPVKGVGPWREGSDYFDMLGVSYIENPRRPGFFREVVPSPSPTGVRDIDTIRMLASSANNIVLCGGGGGIPVTAEGHGPVDVVSLVRGGNGRMAAGDSRTLEASYQVVPEKMVIDKDSTANIIAIEIGTQLLVILTNVNGYKPDFAKRGEDAPTIEWMGSRETFERAHANKIGAGSMNPKMRAGAEFAESDPSRSAIITTPMGLFRLSEHGDGSMATVISDHNLPIVTGNVVRLPLPDY